MIFDFILKCFRKYNKSDDDNENWEIIFSDDYDGYGKIL